MATESEDGPHWWSARKVAAAIASGALSSREYLELLLTRVRQFDAQLGLVVTIDERATRWAERADQAVARGGPLGPLHGVCMTVKDSLATAGLRTTGGSTDLAGHVPSEDAVAVARLRRAGAVVFGKTNLAERSVDLQTINPLFGTGRNPWRPELTPGGSSGGPAGAVAAGFTPLDVGSDVAGSIRIPASNCGVLAHKPSFDVVSTAGHVPPAPYRLIGQDICVVGPLARSVDDLETALDVMAGPHPWDESAWRVELPPARPIARVATWFDDPYCPVDDEVRSALEYAADRLADCGVEVTQARPAGIRLEASDEIFQRLLVPAALPGYSNAELVEICTGRRRPGAELGARYVGQTQRELWEAISRRAVMRRCWQRFFAAYDAILLPVAPNLPGPHDHRPFAERTITVNGSPRPYWDQTVWAGLTGASYLPTTVVPVRLDQRGVPIGVAVAGGYLADRTTLAVARLLAAQMPGLGHPPVPAPAGRSVPDPGVGDPDLGVLQQAQVPVLHPDAR